MSPKFKTCEKKWKLIMNTDSLYMESHIAAWIKTNVDFDIIIIAVLPHRELYLAERLDR